MAAKSAEPNSYRFWNLSTKHLSLDDAKLLLDSLCLVVYEHEYGWLILVPQDDVDETLADVAKYGHSEAVQGLLRAAHDRNIRMIRFDRDGDLVAGIPEFDW